MYSINLSFAQSIYQPFAYINHWHQSIMYSIMCSINHNQFISHLPISIIGINQSFTSINHLHKSIIFTNQSFASIHHWHQLIHSVICLNQSFSSINRLLNQSLASIYQWSINESAFILNRKKYIFFLLWAPLIVISWVSNNCSKSLGYQSLRYINTTWTILS